MADWRTTKIEEPKVEFPSVFNAVDTITQEKINNLPAENLKKAKNAKYALEEIQTKKFYETLKSYYTWRDGDSELTTKGIKTFSDWPTIPQLYIKKEFVGGCDIVKEMYESGELKKVFDKKEINYKK